MAKAKRGIAILASLLISGCVQSPTAIFDKKASDLNVSKSLLKTPQFDISIYQNDKAAGEYLNIYLEGDGKPFFRKVHISPDPTSTKGIALELMSADPQQSYLIGRPCYHQGSNARGCNDTKWWTSHRYNTSIVSALNDAVEQVKFEHGTKSINLIGFSGGGSLASLVAALRNDVNKLITISANLDIDAWTSHNKYTPLHGSQNPIDSIRNVSAEQTHLLGKNDYGLGFPLWVNKLQSIDNSNVIITPNVDHACCWSDHWKASYQKYFE